MGNTGEAETLREGGAALGIELTAEVAEALILLRDELLKWNRKFNLTSITEPREVLEKHLLDSLAILPEVGGAASLLDVGAGGGFPGIPLKLALPAMQVTLVDSVGKKVVFMKNAIARLGLGGSARAIQARVDGAPEGEGLPRVEVAVSRAFRDVGGWVPLAANYLAEGGRVIAMLGQHPGAAVLEGAARAAELRLSGHRTYRLPWSGAERAVAVFQK